MPGASSAPATTQYLDRNDADGVQITKDSTRKVGIWGASPVSRGSMSTIAAPPGNTAATTTTPWGFGTSTQADAVVTAVRAMEFNLRTFGMHVTQ